MTELQDKARELFAKRHPTASYSTVDALAAAWLKATDDNARLLLTSEPLRPTRDMFAENVEVANPDLLPTKPAETTPAPIGKRALKDLTTSEQRALVAEKFGIPAGRLLASDFRRLWSAMLAHEQSTATQPPKPKAKPAPTAKPTLPAGMTAAEFQKLAPQERIRLARAAQKSG